LENCWGVITENNEATKTKRGDNEVARQSCTGCVGRKFKAIGKHHWSGELKRGGAEQRKTALFPHERATEDYRQVEASQQVV